MSLLLIYNFYLDNHSCFNILQVKPPRLGPGRSAEGQREAQPALESKLEPEPPQDTEEDPGRPGAAEAAAVLQVESAA